MLINLLGMWWGRKNFVFVNKKWRKKVFHLITAADGKEIRFISYCWNFDLIMPREYCIHTPFYAHKYIEFFVYTQRESPP